MERWTRSVTNKNVHFEGIKVICVTPFLGGYWKSRRMKAVPYAMRMREFEKSTFERMR
jgi:hypothetical protein